MTIEWNIILRLVIAAGLGLLVGLERELDGQPAGLRTHALAALGSAMFAAISPVAFPNAEPSRIAAGVATGLGFLGGGIIVSEGKSRVYNLTTAAGLWAMGAVGLAIGTGLYAIGIAGTLLIFLLLASGRINFTSRKD